MKIGVQYIGTKYCGWQSQKNAVSVQELVEKALGGVLGHEVRLTASGRTDEGVHARRQVAHFDTDVEIKPFNLILGANVRLPDDIRTTLSTQGETPSEKPTSTVCTWTA